MPVSTIIQALTGADSLGHRNSVSARSHVSLLYPALLLVVLLGGCSTAPRPALTSDACLTTLSDWQQLSVSLPHDAQAKRIDANGLFATDRLLSHLAGKASTPAQRREWLALSSQLAREDRQVLYANNQVPGAQQQAIEACASQALATQQARADQHELPFDNDHLRVADNYHTWQRLLGAYPLARTIVRPRIVKEQQAARRAFGTAAAEAAHRLYGLPVSSSPLTPLEAARLLAEARNNSALALPHLAPDVMTRFINHYAPIWAIDTQAASDIPGQVFWRNDKQPAVDTRQPTLYVKPGMVFWQGEALLQLNYFLWFDERPKEHPLDLYGGRLDGVIWRVTLSSDGRVLAYDSIHQCGCYHQFFVVDKQVTPRPQPYESEPLLVFDTAIPDALSQRILLQLAHSDHAISDVRPTSGDEPLIALQAKDYTEVRSLATTKGRRSLFNRQGLVPQSRRLERFILWPMGVPSAGAMRQWGQHATAFIGRRHFDDPQLFDALFTTGP